MAQWIGDACSDLPEAHGLLIFNEPLRPDSGLEKKIPPIVAKTLKLKLSDEEAEYSVFGEEGESREISEEITSLRRPSEKPAPDWEAKFTAVLHRIDAWQPED